MPESTYRLQFHAGFTFRDATAIVPYLADLGITDCYASPYLKAAPGSTHGYDITNHRLLNPEIGTPDEHSALLEALRDHGLGLVLDVVPNHMGILGNENPWWNDVLENGQASPYAGHRFDRSFGKLRGEHPFGGDRDTCPREHRRPDAFGSGDLQAPLPVWAPCSRATTRA